MAEHERQDPNAIAFGRILEGIENLERRQDNAEKSRTSIHEKLEKLGAEVIRVNNKVTIAQSAIDEMKPTVEDYRKLRDNIHGAVIVIVGIGAVIFTGIGFFVREIVGWIAQHVQLR